jgi:hypothetical protein
MLACVTWNENTDAGRKLKFSIIVDDHGIRDGGGTELFGAFARKLKC